MGLEFAAAVSMSGGYINTVDPQAVASFRHVPIWLIHGNVDTLVDVAYSRNTYRSLVGLPANDPIVFNAFFNPTGPTMRYPTAVTGNVRYTELMNGGHGGWSSLYSSPVIYNWMFAQAVPEPSGVVGAGIGLIALSAIARKRRLGSP
jgi:predicted peptidase